MVDLEGLRLKSDPEKLTRRLLNGLRFKLAFLVGVPAFYCLLAGVAKTFVDHRRVEAPLTGRHLLGNPNCTPPSVDEFPPDLFTLDQKASGAVVLHLLLAFYLFALLGLICEDYFVPSIKIICERLRVPEDVAGATFMAAATSSPELFINGVGTFITEGDIGVGTIVGSAVFNILAVPACCGLFANQVISLHWWPISRDCLMYGVAVLLLIFTLEDSRVEWYEALVLVLVYFGYLAAMYFNAELSRFFKRCSRKKTYKNVSKLEEITPLISNYGKKQENGLAYLNGFTTLSNGTVLSNGTAHKNGVVTRLPNGTAHQNGGIAHLSNVTAHLIGGVTRLPNGNTHHNVGVTNLSNNTAHQNGDITKSTNGTIHPNAGVTHVPNGTAHSNAGVTHVPNGTAHSNAGVTHSSNDSAQQNGDTAHLTNGTAYQNGGLPQKMSGYHTAITLSTTVTDNNNIEYIKCFNEEHEWKNVNLRSWSDEESTLEKAWWVVSWPIRALLYVTIPNCREAGKEKLYPLTFTMCIIYIAVTSYMVAWMITVAGDVAKIPDSVMGLTFLAAGMSVPEAVSSVIVSNQGHGAMGISNSIGSNTFDVLLCLGLPWLIKALLMSSTGGKYVQINSDGILFSTISLLTTLVLLYATFALNSFRLDRKVGVICLLIYACFLAFASVVELNVFFQVNPPTCGR